MAITKPLVFCIAAVLLLALALANAQTPSIEAVERRAFLAGASAGWHPGIDTWVFDKIDRTDPDWEAAFQAWKRTEPR